MALEARTAAARDPQHTERATRQERVLTLTTRIGAGVGAFFTVASISIGHGGMVLGAMGVVSTVIYLAIPLLYRFGELVAPVTFTLAAYALVTGISIHVGTGSGLQFYYLVGASIVVLVLGIDHLALASVLAAVGAVLTIALQVLVPEKTGVQPDWAYTFGFVLSIVSAWFMVVATIWYALREITRAERDIETEYNRSEALLTNILPASIAQRLKARSDSVIADKYEDASVLFADIAGFTRRASEIPPTELVGLLDDLCTRLDALVDRHGLEKIKTTGDSYMVVSGVPEPRPDHLEALAHLALDIAEAAAQYKDSRGHKVPLRIGLAAGPVVAGVVGARKFFYDVWGDAVNVASRMESTGVEGRIQVPQGVYERLNHSFDFEERGDIDVKGKGVMHTWFLVGRRGEQQ
ncbi:adenylate/guanylate cyclase domain-containing protein [Mycobacterium asiaticum]|uniref:Adenylate cyclase n=1 Tax=Mycobacterium asiaticum TaxID=1790 RepID=A0A1A3BR08_MYCAS|nr:adenylate/guanylate cyclase domain-containing protein [Mycobacterium asiaticum]OBI76442.1 adenylate cyclase [Mycobacterium asiaticum]